MIAGRWYRFLEGKLETLGPGLDTLLLLTAAICIFLIFFAPNSLKVLFLAYVYSP